MVELVPVEDEPPFSGVASIACDRMSGTVFVREPESFSKIHILAMKYVLEDPSVTGLLSAFDLGPQVMQEVLADLIFGEAVRIDLENNVAIVCEPYAQLLRDGKTEEIEAALYRTREIKKVHWVMDRSSGQVFAERDISRYLDPPRFEGGFLTLPTLANCPELKKTPDTVLARSAVPILEEILRETDFDISRVEQIEEKRRLPSVTLYVPVRGVRLPTGGRDFLVPDAPGIPLAIQDAWTKLLNRGRESVELPIVNEAPPALASTPKALAAQLEAAIKEFSSLTRHDIRSAAVVDQVGVVLQRIKSGLRTADEMERSQGHLTWAFGDRKRQLDFLGELIADAQETIIIGSAFASVPGLRSLTPILREAANRGVQVSLVVGLPDLDEEGRTPSREDDDIDSFLKQLEPRSRQNISLQRAVRPFHAKFVIVDGRRICASSHNWMTGQPHGGPTELSVATDAPLSVAQVGATVLEWMQPDSRAAVNLNSQLRRTKRKETRVHFFKKYHETIDSAWNELFERPSAAGRAVLQHELEKTLAVIPEIAKLTPALVVLDGEHRSHLFRMIRETSKSVVIASDSVSPNAAGDRFANSLIEAIGRGASITCLWGRQAKASPETSASAKVAEQLRLRLAEALAVRAKLDAASVPLVQIPDAPKENHAKFVLSDDDQILASSFNFLSFGADRPAIALSAELGLLCTSEELGAGLRRFLRKMTE